MGLPPTTSAKAPDTRGPPSIPSAVGNISPNAMLFYVNNTAVGANGAIMAHFVADAEL